MEQLSYEYDKPVKGENVCIPIDIYLYHNNNLSFYPFKNLLRHPNGKVKL